MSYDPAVIAIKKRRNKAGLTQKELAQRAGLSVKTYQRIEQGRADMRFSQYRAILRALSVSDLDISLDTMEVREIAVHDLTASVRLLPSSLKTQMVNLIAEMYRHL